jgi:hypothetical protein
VAATIAVTDIRPEPNQRPAARICAVRATGFARAPTKESVMQKYPTGEVLAAAQQQFDALVRRGVFKPCERFVCRDRDYEERVQEGLGLTWTWYRQQVAAGTVPDVALVVFAARRAMVNRGRTVVGHEHRWHDDVYDRQGIEVALLRLDGVHDHDDDDDQREQDPSLGLARLGVSNPETNWLSAMDLDTWLGELAAEDREMVELRGAGFGLADIGRATRRSVAGVFRRTRQLGHDLAERAGIELEQGSGTRRAPPSAITNSATCGGAP